jgi:hypothetical protein
MQRIDKTHEKENTTPQACFLTQAYLLDKLAHEHVRGAQPLSMLNEFAKHYYETDEKKAPDRLTSAGLRFMGEASLFSGMQIGLKKIGLGALRGPAGLALLGSEFAHLINKSSFIETLSQKLNPFSEENAHLNTYQKLLMLVQYELFESGRWLFYVAGAPAAIIDKYVNQFEAYGQRLVKPVVAGAKAGVKMATQFVQKINTEIQAELGRLQTAKHYALTWLKEKNDLITSEKDCRGEIDSHIKKIAKEEKLTDDQTKFYTFVLTEQLGKYVEISGKKTTVKLAELEKELSQMKKMSLSDEITRAQKKLLQTCVDQKGELQTTLREQSTATEKMFKKYIDQIQLQQRTERIAKITGAAKNLNPEQIESLQNVIDWTEAIQVTGQGLALVGQLCGNKTLMRLAPATTGIANVVNSISAMAISGITLGSVGMFFTGINSLVSCFGGSDDDGLSEALNYIMQQMHMISQQIHHLHSDMLQQFEKVFIALGIIHRDLIKGFSELHKQGALIKSGITELLKGQKEITERLIYMQDSINHFHKDWFTYQQENGYKELRTSIEKCRLRNRGLIDRAIRDESHLELLRDYNLLQAKVSAVAKSEESGSIKKLSKILDKKSSFSGKYFEYSMSYLSKNFIGHGKTPLIDSDAWKETVNILVQINQSLLKQEGDNYRITEIAFKDLDNLRVAGESWITLIATLHKPINVLEKAIDDYTNTLNQFVAVIKQKIAEHEKRAQRDDKFSLATRLPRLSKPRAVDQADKLKKAFSEMKIEFSEHQQASPRQYGAASGQPNGYYRVKYKRTSTGKQQYGSDVFDEWFYDKYGSDAIRKKEFKKLTDSNNKKREDFITQHHKIDQKPIVIHYFDKMETVKQPIVQFAVADNKGATFHPTVLPLINSFSSPVILPLMNSLQAIPAEFLLAERLSLGRVHYSYCLNKKNNLIFTAQFIYLDQEGREQKRLHLSQKELSFSCPKHFTLNEAIWNRWVGGSYYNGDYNKKLLTEFSSGNGHGYETFHLMEPKFETYESAKNNLLKAKDTGLVTKESLQASVQILSSKVSDLFKLLRLDLNSELIKEIQNPEKTLSQLAEKIDVQANIIRSLFSVMYRGYMEQHEMSSLLFTSILDKENLLKILKEYDGDVFYIHHILEVIIQLSMSLKETLREIAKIPDATQFISFKTVMRELTECLVKIKPYCVSEELYLKHNDTTYQKGFEIGSHYATSAIILALRAAKFDKAADLLNKEIKLPLSIEKENKPALTHGMLQALSLKVLEIIPTLMRAGEINAASWLAVFSSEQIKLTTMSSSPMLTYGSFKPQLIERSENKEQVAVPVNSR